jgi:hypothetical protein
MWESGRPVLVGWLLVHVPYPGPLALHSKKVFVTQRRCARYSVSSPSPFAFRFEKPCGPRVDWNALDCRSSSLPTLALTSAPMMILLSAGSLPRRVSRVSRKRA